MGDDDVSLPIKRGVPATSRFGLTFCGCWDPWDAADEVVQRSAQAFLGAELRRLRVDRGLRLADLAQRVGYSVQHASAVERGGVAASEQFVVMCDASLDADGHLVRLLDAVVREQATARHSRQAARRAAP